MQLFSVGRQARGDGDAMCVETELRYYPREGGEIAVAVHEVEHDRERVVLRRC